MNGPSALNPGNFGATKLSPSLLIENNKNDKGNDKKDQDKNKGEDKKEDKGDGEKKEDKNENPKPSGADKQRIDNILDAVNNAEKKVQDKVNAKKVKARPVSNEKDW